MIDFLAAQDAVDDKAFLVRTVGGNKHQQRVTDRLFARIAVKLLGAAIPGGDGGVQRGADDGVVGRLHDRGQALGVQRGAQALDAEADLRS